MFLSAVYYFVGMSKLSREECAVYVERFNNEDNLKLIKDFFGVFKERTGDKYTAQIDEVITAKNYAEMAPKFMALLSKIVKNKDLESLICYCDDIVGTADGRFFSNEILSKELKTACDFSDASCRVMDKLRNGGTNTMYEFRNTYLGSVTQKDILGLTVFDLATIGYASVLNIPYVNKNAINTHLKVFDALIYQDGVYGEHDVLCTKQAFNDFRSDDGAVKRTLFLADHFKLPLIKKYLPELQTSYFGPLLNARMLFCGAIAVLDACRTFYGFYNIIGAIHKELEYLGPVLLYRGDSPLLNLLPPYIIKSFIDTENLFFALSISSFLSFFTYLKTYSEHYNDRLIAPMQSSLTRFVIGSFFRDRMERFEDAFEGGYVRPCLAFATQAIFANVICNAVTTTIDGYLGYSSLASNIVGSLAYTPLMLKVFQVSEKQIYKIANASKIAAESKQQEQLVLQGITSASI